MNKPTISAYQPNLDALRADLHQLLCIFSASESIHRKVQDEPDFAKKHLVFEKLEDDAITKLLLSTAITLRILDEREDGNLEMFSRYCGSLQEGSKSNGLSFRGACNKIIHAKEIEMARNTLSNEITYLFPEIYLSGTDQRKRTWRATVNIYEYVREGMIGITGIT